MIARRTLIAAAALPLAAPFVARAQQALTYKFANNVPATHPLNIRATEAADAIKRRTNGRFSIDIFPNNQLGSDTDTLSQLRSGGVELFTLSGLILATLLPVASIGNTGFAFPDHAAVWKAMDGALGAYVRKQIGTGMVFNQPELAPFREKLRQANFYGEWKAKFGDEAWALLEQTTGKLA